MQCLFMLNIKFRVCDILSCWMEAPPLCSTQHMLTQVQIISLSLSPTATGKTELLLERPAVRTNSVGGRKGVVSGEFSPLLPHSPPSSSSSSSHTINTLKFNTNLLLLQIPNSTSEGYVCTKHFLQFWEVTTSSRQIKFTISTFNICVRSHSLMLTFTLLEKYASTHLVGDKNVQCLLQWEKSHAETWISGTVEQRNTTDHLIILDRFTQIIYQSVFVKVL